MTTTTPETYKLGGTTPYPVTAAGLAQCAIDDLAATDSCVASYLSQFSDCKVAACQTVETSPIAESLIQPHLGKPTADILKSSFKYVALQSVGYRATTTLGTAQGNTYVRRRGDNLDALFNETYARVKKAQWVICSGQDNLSAHPRDYDDLCNQQKLIRMARISGMYAKSFIELEKMNVRIPFVGTAAFASNAVRWNVSKGMGQVHYLNEFAKLKGDTGLANFVAILNDLLNLTFIGNYLVFMEIFPVIDFSIRYLKEFGGQNLSDGLVLDRLRSAQDRFVTYWQDRVQSFPEVIDAVKNTSAKIFRVDRNEGIRNGVGICLGGKPLEGSFENILLNEQTLTLQEYMWNEMREHSLDSLPAQIKEWEPKLLNPLPNLNLWLFDGDMKFAYDSNEQINATRFVLEFGEGDITDANIRYPFTILVVKQFYELYYVGSMEEKVRVLDSLHRMAQDAEGF